MHSDIVVIPSSDTPMELTLAGAGDLRGVVRGLAVDDITVRIAEQGRTVGAYPDLDRTAFPDVDRSGRFHARLAPGTYRVEARRPDRTNVSKVEAIAEVRRGETTLVELSFEGHDVSLAVDTGDRECALLMLQRPGGFADPRGSVALAHCDGDGLTEISGLTPGSYELCVDATCKPVTITESPKRQTHVWR